MSNDLTNTEEDKRQFVRNCVFQAILDCALAKLESSDVDTAGIAQEYADLIIKGLK
jgi:hypothetical protein